jgi:hypothetical protein
MIKEFFGIEFSWTEANANKFNSLAVFGLFEQMWNVEPFEDGPICAANCFLFSKNLKRRSLRGSVLSTEHTVYLSTGVSDGGSSTGV